MADIHAANRQFERLLGYGCFDRDRIPAPVRLPSEGGELIATEIFMRDIEEDECLRPEKYQVSLLKEVEKLDRRFTDVVKDPEYKLDDLTHRKLTYYFFKSRTLMKWAAASMDAKGYQAASQLDFQLRAQLGLPLTDD